MKNLKLNPQLRTNEVLIPKTNLNAYIIDDFLLNTDSVMNFAQNIAYFNPMYSDNSYYPGVRDKMPEPYIKLLQGFFQEIILPKLRGREKYQVNVHKSLISLVTCPPSKLLPEQKMPHVDSCKNNAFAFVHYLSPKSLGGTSIYRYIPDDIVELNEKGESTLNKMVNGVLSTPDEHQGYLNASTSLFEQILKVEAKFNRLVIYQGNLLHSANLTTKESYCGNTSHGRLSITSFASILNK